MDIIVNSFPLGKGFGGGAKRSYNVLQHYADCGMTPYLYIPVNTLAYIKSQDRNNNLIGELKRTLEVLSHKDVRIPEYIFDIIENEQISNLFGRRTLRTFSMLGTLQIFNSKYAKYEAETTRRFALQARNAKAVYCMHETYDHCMTSMRLATVLHLPLVVLLQNDPFEKELNTFRFLPKDYSAKLIPSYSYTHLINHFNQRSNRILFLQMLRSGTLKAMFAPSSAPFINSGLDELAGSYDVPTKILRPGNAHDVPQNAKRTLKESQGIFFARIVPEKGIFEIPYIWRLINEAFPNAHLNIYGQFPSRLNKATFFRIVSKLGLLSTIKYDGFADTNKLYDKIRSSKLFLYPSHTDCFPLGILEAIANQTTVVAYNIPAVRSSYQGIECIHRVPEWDIAQMAREAIKILRMGDDDYYREHINQRTMDYVRLHSSWSLVASSEISLLKKTLALS